MTETEFVPAEFVAPVEVTFGEMRLLPLGPEHNESDHDAWTASIEHIRNTPGFPDGSWPRPMSLDDNRRDLERHADDFRMRRGFTYTVLDTAGRVVGCVYIYPGGEPGQARVQSWVRLDRADLDRPLYEAVYAWLRADWPFRTIDYDEHTA